MNEIEQAVFGHRIAALSALDELTPRVRQEAVVAQVGPVEDHRACPRMPELIFRKGFSLKHEVAGSLAADYHSELVQQIKADDFTYRNGRLTVHLAREFGFCYGVDRAVDYAYQARHRFPDQTVYLTGEIIHNPHVNEKLRALGIRFLSDPGCSLDALGAGDVVILPAFGVTVGLLAQLQRQGCTLVDTTCGSVLNVWKNVRQYARDGFTSVIHGKVHHEETQATASQATGASPDGRYLVVLNRAEARTVCDYIRDGGDPAAFLVRFGDAASPGLRSRPRPRQDRPGQPDDDADVRVAGDRRDVPGRHGRPLRRRRRSPTGSGPSRRSAAPRRTGRTRSSRCSTAHRST